MNKSLHLAFLATAMATTSTIASAAAPLTPVPVVPGVTKLTFTGTATEEFDVLLAPGVYEITGTLAGTADKSGKGGNGFNVTGVSLSLEGVPGSAGSFAAGTVRDSFLEGKYDFTLFTPTELLLDVATNANKKNAGTYQGTLTVTGSPLVSAVPETGTAALLLAGLGVLSIAARRRRA